jgi:hypothetical protein
MSDASSAGGTQQPVTEEVARLRRLEIFRSSLTFLGQFLIALSGLGISFVLSESNHHHEAEARRVEEALQIYKEVKNDLNSLYIFPCRVGNYDTMTPSEAGTLKRKLDKYFVINVAFISPETFEAYTRFKQQFVLENRGVGKHFVFMTDGKYYKTAYQLRRDEYLKRGGLPTGPNSPPEVSDAELEEWFTNELIPDAGKKIAYSYAQLLSSFAGDAGYGYGRNDGQSAKFTCFYPTEAKG